MEEVSRLVVLVPSLISNQSYGSLVPSTHREMISMQRDSGYKLAGTQTYSIP
jgi:hypothetical protein